MKKIALLVAIYIALIVQATKGQNLIAVQNGGAPAFYPTLVEAITNSVNGDTLYLPGGYIQSSGIIKINKAIHIVGVGYRSDSNSVMGNTIFQNNIEITSTVDGGSITGIYAEGCQLSIHDSVTNFSIKRCYFSNIILGSGQGIIPASDINITETIATGYIYANSNNSTCPGSILISNCYIGNYSWHQFYCSNPLYSSGGNWSNLTCLNSIICGTSQVNCGAYCGCTNQFLKQINYSVFKNCIFIDKVNYTFSGSNNNFYNCLFTSSSGSVPGMPSNLVANCIWDQTSIFVNAQNGAFDLAMNFQLAINSPGKNAGSDGTDIGIYGGMFPWKDGAIPCYPHLQSVQIGTATDPVGNLNVNIKVAAQDR